MKIKIGFSSPINHPFPILSWAIKTIYNTPYSHCYLKFHSDSLERDIIYEAVGVGVRFVGANLWSQHAEVIKEFEIDLSSDQYTELMRFCIDHAGIEYGKVQVLGIYAAKLFRMRENPFKNDDSLEVCSEIIGRILEQLGYEFNKSLDLISPKDIFEELDSKKGLILSP
jgi:hypothetical protein